MAPTAPQTRLPLCTPGCRARALGANHEGDTLLHVALRKGDHAFVRELVRMGSDLEAVNVSGEAFDPATPTHSPIHLKLAQQRGAKWRASPVGVTRLLKRRVPPAETACPAC